MSLKKVCLDFLKKIFPWTKDLNVEEFPLLSTLFCEKRFNITEFLKIVEDEIGLGFYEGKEISVDRSLISLIPKDIATSYGVIPLRKERDKLVLGVPFNTSSKILRAIEELIDSKIKPVYLPLKPIKEAIAKNYGEMEFMEKIFTVLDERRGVIPQKITSLTTLSPAEDWLRSIIAEAIKRRGRKIDFIKNEEGIEVWVNGEKGIERIASLQESIYELILKKISFYANLLFRDFSYPFSRRIKLLVKDKFFYLNIINFPFVNSSVLSLEIWDPNTVHSGFIEAIKPVKEFLVLIENLLKEKKGTLFFLSGESSIEKSFLYELLTFLRREYKLKKVLSLEREIFSYIPLIHQLQYEPGFLLKLLSKAIETQPELTYLELEDKKDIKSVLVYSSRTFLFVKPPFQRLDELQIFLREARLIPAIKAGVINGICLLRVFKNACPKCSEEIDVPEELRYFGLEGKVRINKGCNLCSGEVFPYTFILDFIPAKKDAPEQILLVKPKIPEIAMEKVKEGILEMESFIDFILKYEEF